jgi:hypothetical protein
MQIVTGIVVKLLGTYPVWCDFRRHSPRYVVCYHSHERFGLNGESDSLFWNGGSYVLDWGLIGPLAPIRIIS